MASGDRTLRDMDAAANTIAMSRLVASQYRQMGFKALASFHIENARGAERWLRKAAKVYPLRCASAGRGVAEIDEVLK